MNRSKRFFSTIFTITMALTCTIPAMATEITNDTTPYVFPVQPGSTEWKSFTTKQEMIDVCQIPEEKLKSMSTEALLETVLNYPLVTTYYAFNSVEDAYNVMLSDFNGFNELLSRSDVTETLLNTYANTEILTASKAASAQPKEFFEPATIEYLIACNEIQNGDMSIDETEKFELLLE